MLDERVETHTLRQGDRNQEAEMSTGTDCKVSHNHPWRKILVLSARP